MTTRLYGEILPDNDQTRARQEHFREILQLVGNPYPNRFDRSRVTKSEEGEDTVSSVVMEFKKHEPGAEPGAKPTPEQLDEACAQLPPTPVRISGRLATPARVMGKAAFVHLSDGKERLQIYVRKQEARAISNDSLQPVEQEESGWKLFQLLDHGDFVGVEGKLFVTKTGELSVHVETIQFLSKALLPMPDKMHGISDPEIRQRQRYADLIASSLKVKADEADGGPPHELSTREVFERRSKLITAMRRHLDDHGYIEVETPMLSPIASGAAARPFRTHHNALDIDLYLRIAPELYLKRLLVGGFERVYELNRNFRNEGISTRHNPEFTMLEFYTAYKDVNWMMDFCEEMLQATIQHVAGELQVNYTEPKLGFHTDTESSSEQVTIDFSKFERLTMRQAVAREMQDFMKNLIGTDVVTWLEDGRNLKILRDFHGWFVADFRDEYIAEEDEDGIPTKFLSNEEVDELFTRRWKESNQRHGVTRLSNEDSATDLIKLFESIAEQKLIQPTFIIDFPKVVSPLSKASPNDSTIAERFELYVAGMEVANGFSELNDPAEQLERFEEQARQREGGDEEAMQMDEDYVKALAYGMPPAAGIGIGVDRLTMLLTNRRSIRDVILFPHMRPRQAAEEQAQEGHEQPPDS